METTSDLEFAMHKTWRANGKMLDLTIGGHPWPTRDQIIERLTMAIDELQECRDLISRKKSDVLGYYDEKTQRMGAYEDNQSVNNQ